MLQAEPRQVLGSIIVGPLVEMRQLPFLHSLEAVEIEAEATSPLTSD
jgi:hypothetical protein